MEFNIGDIVYVDPEMDRSGTDCFDALVGVKATVIEFYRGEVGLNFNDELHTNSIFRSLYAEQRKNDEGHVFHNLHDNIGTNTGWYVKPHLLKHYDENPVEKFFKKHPLER
jgi:hypothetical protein